VVGLSETTIIGVLQNLGLTEKEAEVYIYLAKRGPIKGMEVAKHLRKHKAQIYRILRRLQAKNIVEATLEAPTRFAAVSFEKVLDQFIKIKQEEAVFVERKKKDWLRNWEGISKSRIQPTAEKFAVIEGSKKIYSRILQMITETKKQFSAILSVQGLARGEQFGIFDAAYNHPLKSNIAFQFLTELQKKHLKAMKLLIPKLKTEIDVRAIESGSESRLLPRMVIRDGEEILFFISPRTDLFLTSKNESCLFINSKSLVQTLIGTFEDLWKHSNNIKDKILEIETGKLMPESFVEKDIETISYDTAFSSVKEQLRSLPLLTAQLTRIERSLPTFVGRQKELKQLKESLDKALAGTGTTVLITGKVGIGKTRLANELLLHALSKKFKVVKCSCPQDSGVNQSLLKKILMDLFELIDDETIEVRRKKIKDQIEDFAPQFTSLVPVVDNIVSSQNIRIEVFSEEALVSQEDLAFLLKSESCIANLAQLLILFSKKQSLVLFVDDMQFADSSSLKLFRNLARKIKKSNLLLIGAYRKEDVIKTYEGTTPPFFENSEVFNAESLAQKIELNRLSQMDCYELINNVLDIYDYRLAKLIYEETGGNPFFILETIKYLINKKFLIPKGKRWHITRNLNEIEIPHTIQDLISRRINGLRDEERDVLDCASVVGERFSSDLIEKVTGFNRLQVLRRLNRIERKYQLVHSSNGKYRFDHSKIREVLYQAIAPELRKEYHSLIAENLEKSYKNHLDYEIDQLAYHYYKSSNSPKAIPYLLEAGKRSRKQYALFETIRSFSQALKMMKDDEQWKSERTETLEALGDLHGFVAEHELANKCYIRGIANTDDKLAKDRLQKKIRRKKIVENKGVKLSYYVYGEGEPTILLVSWTSSTEVWIPQVTYFSQKYTVVTFDMRGTGESDKPLGKYTVDVHAEDLNVIIDDLQAKNIIMVGAHYGGKIAVTYVTKYPGKISKLVLLGFLPAPFSEVVNKEKFEKYRKMALKSPSWFVNGFWTSAFSGQGFESLIEWGLKSSQRTPPEIFRDNVYNVWSVDVRPLLEKINIPTLIIGGNKNANDLAQVNFLHEKIPKSKIYVSKGKNSDLLNIFAASEFNQTVENYIKN
jgi:pimeloyl-ACP methyl ester carboxylesterase/sugar-specific transcriptional regulator TrmB/KaiC/GvpD/RAD55 family RecA-like ATPase